MTARSCAASGLLLGLLLLGGCGPSRPTIADPERSKEVLRATLDAWRQGEPPEALKGRAPPIHANDPDWAGGAKLERYEIKEGDGKHVGYDFSCPVTLWLWSGGANLRSRTVRYTVGTRPALVVVRDLGH